MKEVVILVDQHDNEIGTEEKIEAHRKGLLHRAFSIFIFNKNDKMLIHQRAFSKYHSGGLWTNTCCSHPRPHEKTIDAAHRRLQEELGFDCDLEEQFSFIYRVDLVQDGLIEHEFDHVFFGRYEGPMNLNPDEIADIAWVDIEELSIDIKQHPEKYTYWFAVCWERVVSHAQQYLYKGV